MQQKNNNVSIKNGIFKKENKKKKSLKKGQKTDQTDNAHRCQGDKV